MDRNKGNWSGEKSETCKEFVERERKSEKNNGERAKETKERDTDRMLAKAFKRDSMKVKAGGRTREMVE